MGDRRRSTRFCEEFRPVNVRQEHPRDGISLLISDFTPERDMVVPYQVAEGAVNIGTILSGHFTDDTCGGRTSIRIHRPAHVVDSWRV